MTQKFCENGNSRTRLFEPHKKIHALFNYEAAEYIVGRELQQPDIAVTVSHHNYL
jgi:hypothetical protein